MNDCFRREVGALYVTYVRYVRKVAIIGEFNCTCDQLTCGETERRRQLQVLWF
jgi:hypothetical protein